MPLGILVLCAVLAPAAVFAQAAEAPAVDVASGLNGYYTVGRWMPVRVAAEARDAEFTGELVVEWGATTYRQALSLPAPSRKRLEFYVRAADLRDVLRVELRNAAADTVATYDVPMRGVLPAESLHVVVDAVEARPSGTHTAFVLAGDLPVSWRGYDGVDEVEIETSATRLTAAQSAALSRWRRVRHVDDAGPLRAAIPEAAGRTRVDETRWRFLAVYASILAVTLALTPALTRRAWALHAMIAVLAIMFIVTARGIGRVAVAGAPDQPRTRMFASPGLDARFATTILFARPIARTETVVAPPFVEVLLEAAPDAPPHEVRYSEGGAATFAIAGSVGETFSVLARGFIRGSAGD